MNTLVSRLATASTISGGIQPLMPAQHEQGGDQIEDRVVEAVQAEGARTDDAQAQADQPGEQADPEQPRDRPQPELAVIGVGQDRDDQHLREAQRLERRGGFAEQRLHANGQVRRQHAVLRQVAARAVDHAVDAHQRHAVGVVAAQHHLPAGEQHDDCEQRRARQGERQRPPSRARVHASDVVWSVDQRQGGLICHTPRQPTIL